MQNTPATKNLAAVIAGVVVVAAVADLAIADLAGLVHKGSGVAAEAEVFVRKVSVGRVPVDLVAVKAAIVVVVAEEVSADVMIGAVVSAAVRKNGANFRLCRRSM